MNCSFVVAILGIAILSCCKSSDIESNLDDAKDAINNLANLGKVEDYLDTLTSLDDWGTRSVLSTAMTVLLLAQDGEWKEDEVSLSIWNKYLGLKEAINTLKFQINDIDQTIDLNKFPVSLRSVDSKLKDMDEKIELILQDNENAETHKQNFFAMYEENHNGVSETLYTAVTSASDSIFELTKQDLENDKSKTFKVVILTNVMLLHSLSIDTTYKLLKCESDDEIDSTLKEIFSKWEPRFTELVEIVTKLDAELTDAWKQQYTLDVQSFLKTQTSQSSNTMAEGLQNLLANKFYWRNWFVVITQTLKSDEIEINNCDGYSLMSYNKKNIFVNSGDSKETFNTQLATNNLGKAKAIVNVWFSDKKAQLINERIPASCSNFKMFGTFAKNTESGVKVDAVIIGRNVQLDTSTLKFISKRKFTSFIMG